MLSKLVLTGKRCIHCHLINQDPARLSWQGSPWHLPAQCIKLLQSNHIQRPSRFSGPHRAGLAIEEHLLLAKPCTALLRAGKQKGRKDIVLGPSGLAYFLHSWVKPP